MKYAYATSKSTEGYISGPSMKNLLLSKSPQLWKLTHIWRRKGSQVAAEQGSLAVRIKPAPDHQRSWLDQKFKFMHYLYQFPFGTFLGLIILL